MLILSRKVAEEIRIGDSIVVKVIRCSSGRVRLGIEAPREVRVIRDELETTGKIYQLEATEGGAA